MSEINVRKSGRAGRITLTRPKALNALSYDMCMAIHKALIDWRDDPTVDLVVMDAEGDKAFCAGGDIAEMYRTGTSGDLEYSRKFWRDEYAMNAEIAEYKKPIISFLQGFVMGGGVGVGCHGSHRVVDTDTRIAMPESGIGLIPDVGGTYLLARAPGRLGEYLGTTGARMDPDDAIQAGFADLFIPRDQWPALIETLERDGDPACLSEHAQTPAPGEMRALRPDIDLLFSGETLGDIAAALRAEDSDFARATLKVLERNSPISMAWTIAAIRQLRGPDLTIRAALEMEYRFTHRSMDQGDFLEGVRAQIIDKDRQPKWRQPDLNVAPETLNAMLAPLGADALTFT